MPPKKNPHKNTALTKGKLAEKTGSSTKGTSLSQPSSQPVTSFVIFERSIQRAQNLLKIKQSSLGADQIADARRAAIVLAVAALDAFIRAFVIEKIIATLANLKQNVPDRLKDQAKEILGHDGLFDAARNCDLGTRLEKGFRDQFGEKSFQGIKNIQDVMKLVGHDNIFHTIALSARVNEDHLKSDLGIYTKRRHIIAHCGDYEINQTPPTEKPVSDTDVRKCIKTVVTIAKEIYKLK